MKTIALAILLAASAVPLAKTSPANQYPETIAVLHFLYGDEYKLSRTYNAYARQARAEKHLNIESFFAALERAAILRAEAAAGVLAELGVTPVAPNESDIRVSSTRLNLKLMANIETPKMERRYPMLLDKIKPENHALAIQNVTHAWKVDKGHRELAQEILSSMESFFGIGARIPNEFYVCQNCGAVAAGRPDYTCPVCQGPISDYELAHAKWRVYRALDNSRELTDEERAFAKRMYDYIYENTDQSQYVSLGMSDLYSDVYAKWGLGPNRDFCLEEKIYIKQLEEMVAAWQIYKSINIASLDEADKTFLQEIHDKYGAGPINLRKEQAREKNRNATEVQKLLDLVEIAAGRTELTDQDLLLFKALIAKSNN